jgi:hypothetical protein
MAWDQPLTFLQLYREQLQSLHSLLQLIFCGGCHGIHILIATVIVLIGIGAEHLGRGSLSEAGRMGRAELAGGG